MLNLLLTCTEHQRLQMTSKPASNGRQAASNQRKVTNFRKVHQLTYQERLYAKTGDIPSAKNRGYALLALIALRIVCRCKGSCSQQVSACSVSAWCSAFKQSSIATAFIQCNSDRHGVSLGRAEYTPVRDGSNASSFGVAER